MQIAYSPKQLKILQSDYITKKGKKQMGIKQGTKRRTDKYYIDLIHKNKRLYKIWLGMKSRCFDKNFPTYKYYGERGITICNDWRNNFESFYNWSISNRL